MKIANIRNFNKYSIYFEYITLISSFALIILGLYYSFLNSPADYQQGDFVRIMYIHVPSAWLALIGYVFLASSNICGFIWKNPLLHIISISSAPIGASFAFICLVTGSIWGKPIWGTWWVWDARLTSMLILFIFYLGYILVYHSIIDKIKADKLSAILSIIGLINIPIVKFSVNWWNSLHQDASILRSGGSRIDPQMLTPLLLMFFSLFLFCIYLTILRTKTEIINRKLERINLR